MLTLLACEAEISQEEIDNVSTTYAEILIAESQYPDTVEQARVIDSIITVQGYTTRTAFNEQMRQLGEKPEQFRTILDSIQFKLERVRTDTTDTQ